MSFKISIKDSIKRTLELWLIVILTSCEKEVRIQWPQSEDKMVMSSVLVCGEPIRMKITKTIQYPFDDDHSFIQNAMAIVHCGERSDTLRHVGEGWYESPNIVVEGARYEAMARFEGQSIHACDFIPKSVFQYEVSNYMDSVSIDEEGTRYSQFEIRFKDSLSTKDFYEVGIEIHNSYNSSIGYHYEHYQYWPCRSSDLSVLEEGLQSHYPPTVIFSDRMFDGEHKHLVVQYSPPKWNTGAVIDYDEVVVHFRHVSENHFHYKKKLAMHLSGLESDFWQGAGDPVPMFSNVEGGYGIFAGYWERTDTIHKKTHSYTNDANDIVP